MNKKYFYKSKSVASLLRNKRDYNFFLNCVIKKNMSIEAAFELTERTKEQKRRKPDKPIKTNKRKYYYNGEAIRDIFTDKKDRDYFYVMRHNGLTVKEAVERTKKVSQLRASKWKRFKNGK